MVLVAFVIAVSASAFVGGRVVSLHLRGIEASLESRISIAPRVGASTDVTTKAVVEPRPDSAYFFAADEVVLLRISMSE